MKKLVVLFTITLMALSADAQFYVGIKAGGGLTGLTSNGTYGHLFGIGTQYGLAYKQQITERIMLEGDILLDVRSTVVDDEFSTLLVSQYISVPLTAHWMIPFRKKELVPYYVGQPKSFFFVEGGPAINIGLSLDNYIDPIALIGLEPEDVAAFTASTNVLDIAFVGGMGINFGFEKSQNRLVIGARSSVGFLNYNKYPNAPTFKNMAHVGYLQFDFSLSKRRYYQYRW